MDVPGAAMNVALNCELDNVLLPCLNAVVSAKLPFEHVKDAGGQYLDCATQLLRDDDEIEQAMQSKLLTLHEDKQHVLVYDLF
ncbi:hypothetical protein PRIC1_009730 [Phytophthora ramorum]